MVATNLVKFGGDVIVSDTLARIDGSFKIVVLFKETVFPDEEILQNPGQNQLGLPASSRVQLWLPLSRTRSLWASTEAWHKDSHTGGATATPRRATRHGRSRLQVHHLRRPLA